MKTCLLIPHYNHERQFIAFLPELMALGMSCIIIDDGSDSDSVAQLERFVEGKQDIHLIKHAHNRGKGAAVITGLCYARALGFSHALQVDADGQHSLDNIPEFLSQSEVHPKAMICGKPIFDDSVPKARLHGRKVTTVIVAIETLSTKIKDGLCGFRIYPLSQMEQVLDRHYIGPRMDFDTEILVKSVWMNIELRFIGLNVIYPEESVSHFNYLRDNLVLIRLHTRLLFGALVRFPWLLWHRVKGR
jgi:glycosyltransferase involved in cell wall biosynthesis